MRISVFLFLGVVFLISPLHGQTVGSQPVQEANKEATASSDTIKAILEQENEPRPGSYTYSPQGRRDPFVNLLKPVGPDQGSSKRKPGMEGFLIQEVALKGVVKTPKGYIAMLVGTDTKSYFVSVGQRLFDGQLVALDAATATFRQELTDPLSPVRTREVRKTLYPSEEAKQ